MTKLQKDIETLLNTGKVAVKGKANAEKVEKAFYNKNGVHCEMKKVSPTLWKVTSPFVAI